MSDSTEHFRNEGAICPLHPIDWLREEYLKRRKRNPAYSMRAFANFLKVSPGALSEILSKKRRLTQGLGARLADRLGFTPEERQNFLALIAETNPSPKELRTQFQKRIPKHTYTSIQADQFAIISDWEHFAIISLTETENFQPDPRWIAKRLGISLIQVEQALDRLLRLGMLVKRDNTYRSTETNWTTTHDIPSSALRRSHRQSMEQAIESLENTPVHERSVSSVTMAINLDKLEEANKRIAEFRRMMADFLEESPKTEVYNLNIQLVPVTKGTPA